MKKLSILLILSFLFFSKNSFACTCPGDWSFCETIDDSYFISEAKVIKKYISADTGEEHMDVKILEVLQNSISFDTLTVTTHQILCHYPLYVFNVGDTLIINLNETYPITGVQNHEVIEFSLCFTNFLNLSNSNVTGFISPSLNTQNYDEFKLNLGECNNIIASDENLNKLETEIKILKNPTTDFSIIDFANLETAQIVIEVFSTQGERIFIANNIQNSRVPIPLNEFPQGIYFVKIWNKNNFILKKVVRI